jgi:hypothetical protein
MAKKKSPIVSVVEPLAPATIAGSESAEMAGRFVGQWRRLVSTTNWEKGRIICQWREALELAGEPATSYSDEAWSQLVGGVTSQHVGRLRRVFQRFGAVYDQYNGLYWSHFQAGLDWEDAEMWLEGAILNGWSVSQMRGKRWETLGHLGDPPQDEIARDEDDDPLDGEAASVAGSAVAPFSTPSLDQSKPTSERSRSVDASKAEIGEAPPDGALEHEPDSAAPPAPAKTRQALSVDVDDLPGDLADAFEQFKLAIIAHRRSGWRETTPAAVIECLDALRELTLAPADD